MQAELDRTTAEFLPTDESRMETCVATNLGRETS